MNYNLSQDSAEKILKLLDSNENLKIVENYDELFLEMKEKKAFIGFKEFPIKFPPTFKGKNRKSLSLTSYQNRIMYRSSSISLLEYNSYPEFNLPVEPIYLLFLLDFSHQTKEQEDFIGGPISLFDTLSYVQLLKPYKDDNISIEAGEVVVINKKNGDETEYKYKDTIFKSNSLEAMEVVALTNTSTGVFYMNKIRFELFCDFINSEKDYVRFLKLGVEQFEIPLKQILDTDVHQKIFQNLQNIYDLNSNFLKDLLENFNKLDVTKIREVLHNYTKEFKMYSDYIKIYQTSSKVLKEELVKNSKLSNFINSKNSLLKKYSLDNLESILVMPIQRLPRYRLLYENLLKFTPEKDKEEGFKVVKMINEILDYANEKTREYELELSMNYIVKEYGIFHDSNQKIFFEKKQSQKLFLLEFDKVSLMTEFYLLSSFILFQIKGKRYIKKNNRLRWKEIDSTNLEPKTFTSEKKLVKIQKGFELSSEYFISNIVTDDDDTYKSLKDSLIILTKHIK